VTGRTAQLSRLCSEHQVAAVYCQHIPNLRYLTGFTGTAGALLYSPTAAIFLTDSRYTTQARDQLSGLAVQECSQRPKAVVDWLIQNNLQRVGFEAETLTCAELLRLQDANPDLEWVPLGKPLSQLRGCKQTDEIATLRRAAAIGAAALAEVQPLLRPGLRELDFALELEFALKRGGAEEKSFDFIVASGERGALPHGIASDRCMQAGELITIDFGARYAGYHHDETVTLALGEVDAELQQVYTTVLAAHDLAIAELRPGVELRKIDALARDTITAAGYGDFFGHGLGHGVGLEVHEFPTLSPRSDSIAEEGMVVTVEPGVYLPGQGGVRIEDMVQVTATGTEVLTQVNKDWGQLAV